MRILEADTQLAATAEEYLRRNGHALDRVCSGRQMIDAVEGHCYEAVVPSMNLPRDDPIALLARLKRQSRPPESKYTYSPIDATSFSAPHESISWNLLATLLDSPVTRVQASFK